MQTKAKVARPHNGTLKKQKAELLEMIRDAQQRALELDLEFEAYLLQMAVTSLDEGST